MRGTHERARLRRNQDIFDVRRIRRLVKPMKEHDLGEIDLQRGRCGFDSAGAAVAPAVSESPPVAGVPAPAAAGPPRRNWWRPRPPKGAATASCWVKSPMSARSTPLRSRFAPFVKVGDHVGPETIVCIVEGMEGPSIGFRRKYRAASLRCWSKTAHPSMRPTSVQS